MQDAEAAARALTRALSTSDAAVHYDDVEIIKVATASAKNNRWLEIRVRDAWDFEVAFHVPELYGSPIEQVFVGPPREAASVLAEVVDFVCGLVAERIALVDDRRWFRWSRRFVPKDDVQGKFEGDRVSVFTLRGAHDSNARTV